MKLKQFMLLSVLTCMLSIPGLTSAADLSVSGHIESVSACNVALGNNGVADLGNLSRKDIRTLFVRSSYMSLRINCQHPTKVGVGVIDNRKGTVPPSEQIFGDQVFGLGNPAIGSYVIASDGFPRPTDERPFGFGEVKAIFLGGAIKGGTPSGAAARSFPGTWMGRRRSQWRSRRWRIHC